MYGIALAQLRAMLHPDLDEMLLDLDVDDAVLAEILHEIDAARNAARADLERARTQADRDQPLRAERACENKIGPGHDQLVATHLTGQKIHWRTADERRD